MTIAHLTMTSASILLLGPSSRGILFPKGRMEGCCSTQPFADLPCRTSYQVQKN
jgi:hypothetical protein